MSEGHMETLNKGLDVTDDEKLLMTEEALEEILKQRELELERIKVEKELFEVINPRLRKLTPETEFETDDAYWELQRKLHRIQFDKNMIQVDNQLRQLNKVVTVRENEVKQLKGEMK